MKFQTVVIDANILIRDYSLRGNTLQKIVKTKKFYELEVCIPEVVLDECIGHYAQSVEVASKELAVLSDKFERLDLHGALSKSLASRRLGAACRKYERRLKEFISSNGVVLLPYPTVKHKSVVDRMYQKRKPFTDGSVREKGYKDFLIVASIEEYMKQGMRDNVLLLTENVSDFACTEAVARKDTGLLPLDDQYDLPNVYVARSPALLFSALSSSLGQTCSSEIVSAFNDKLVVALREQLSNLDAELLLEIFSSFLDVSIERETICLNVIESQVDIDDECRIMEARGIIRVSFQCKFSVDNFDVRVKIVDDQFLFMNKIKDRVSQKGLSWRGEWSEDFSNVKFDKEFLFEYVDFDYMGVTNDLDKLFLSISRL